MQRNIPSVWWRPKIPWCPKYNIWHANCWSVYTCRKCGIWKQLPFISFFLSCDASFWVSCTPQFGCTGNCQSRQTFSQAFLTLNSSFHAPSWMQHVTNECVTTSCLLLFLVFVSGIWEVTLPGKEPWSSELIVGRGHMVRRRGCLSDRIWRIICLLKLSVPKHFLRQATIIQSLDLLALEKMSIYFEKQV